MDAQQSRVETRKRRNIVTSLHNYVDLSYCRAVLLTGSLAYGKNLLVHQHSDIDLLCIVDQHHAQALKQMDFFYGPYLNDTAFALFEAGDVDGIFSDYLIDTIKINIGIWRYDFLQAFLQLQAASIRRYRGGCNMRY